jgi:hypothetical protein
MGKKINKIINKFKPKKKIEKVKPIEIKKPTFSELRDFVTKRKKYAESLNFYKQKVEGKLVALKRLENKLNKTGQTLEHENTLETELRLLEAQRRCFAQTYDEWYTRNKYILDLKSKEEELLNLIKYQELEIRRNTEKIRELEEKTETDNTEMYIHQLIDERKVNKEICDRLKETFKKGWINRHKK